MRPDVRKVINGRCYDTQTAEWIMGIPDLSCHGSSNWENTALYRTKRGTFFVAGEGGASSQWRRVQVGGGFVDGEGLRLIDEREARELMEQHDGPVETYFEIEEG